MPRAFKWDSWDFDLDGSAYIIAADECPDKADVPDYICREDRIHSECKPEMIVEEGWCKFQVRSDFYEHEGERTGSYVVEKHPHMSTAFKGKRGWFKVWIVRKEEWY